MPPEAETSPEESRRPEQETSPEAEASPEESRRPEQEAPPEAETSPEVDSAAPDRVAAPLSEETDTAILESAFTGEPAAAVQEKPMTENRDTTPPQTAVMVRPEASLAERPTGFLAGLRALWQWICGLFSAFRERAG